MNGDDRQALARAVRAVRKKAGLPSVEGTGAQRQVTE